MAAAEVGDDVLGNDPTVARLQEKTAAMLGKEAAIFMPSGSMTNQIAIRIHCRPGDEFLCEANCHIYNNEQGAFAQLGGIVARTIQGEAGVLRQEQLSGLIRPENDQLVRTRLVCLENTHNQGGGRIQPYEAVKSICRWAKENGLRRHLDGARLFNAAVATGIDLSNWAKHFDTVSVCFSKGLGAPVGSALAGPTDVIREARRHRKLFGGGMRQVGIIAAGALHALENHYDRLQEDHDKAQILASAIREIPTLTLQPDSVDTNIVIFSVSSQLGSASDFVNGLAERGVLMLTVGPDLVRAVTHMDCSQREAELAAQSIRELAMSNESSRASRDR